jgi:FSR family fosmidomycin resistance protein-like MFS transporter
MLLVLAYGHFATDVCQSALPTILPLLKAKLLLSYTTAGVILLASNLTSSVIQPLFGYWSDQREKGFLLPAGCLCAGLGLSLLAVPDNYAVVLLLVVLSGLGVASYHPEGFKTARFFTGPRVASGLAVFTVGGNIGLAVGPLAAAAVTTYLGLEFLPLMILFSLAFVILLALHRRLLARARTQIMQEKVPQPRATRRARVAVGLIVAAVIMRSWTHFGLMAYIPFYYIDHERGDPLYAGALVSVFLFGGAIGTLAGSPLADRWGYKRFLMLSLGLSAAILPLVLVTHGVALFVTLGAVGVVLISTFTVTIAMAQNLLPNSLGVASGLLAGFAIGTGGIGVTFLGVIADHFGGAPAALKVIMLFPPLGLLISCFIKFPQERRTWITS